MPVNQNEITQLLLDLSHDDKAVVNKLMPLVYDKLRELAQRQLLRERANHTLNGTDLAHEAYLKLVDQNRVTWQNRAHFFAIAAQAMRRILINYANKKKAGKRGGGEFIVTFNEKSMLRETRAEELLFLDESLDELATLNQRQSKVVEYRFFGGLSHKEIAQVMNVSIPTVRRDWRLARAWLSKELKQNF